MQAYSKAIAALLTQVLTLAAMFGVERPEWLTDETVASIGGVLTVLMVFVVRNGRDVWTPEKRAQKTADDIERHTP